MKEEKFKVINFIRELIVYMDQHLQNFPKKDIEIKSKLKEESYELLELAYKANITREENRADLIEDIIAKIKVIDFLLNLCYDKQIINSKRYVKFGEKLDDIMKYAAGWKKTINNEKSSIN
ncbi:MAG: four helix bundle protein [Clostridia bacterium]